MTKKLSLVLAILMLLGLCLTACQSTPADSADPTKAPVADTNTDNAGDDTDDATTDDAASGDGLVDDANFNPSGWPVCKEKEELHVLTSRSTYAPEDLNELYIIQQAEAITNVHINWESYTDTTYTEKYNIILASGEYPDVISNGMSFLMQAQYGVDEGVFIKQDAYVDAYMTELQRLFDSKPALRAYITAADGYMYAIPRLNEGGWMQSGNMMIVNTNWLDEVGMDMPTNLNEFKEVLKAFKDNDCNGNGDATDEVPLYALLNLVGYNSANTGLQHIFSAFGLNMAASYLDADDEGNVFYTAATEEYKAAIKYLRELAAEGLFSTLGFSSDWDTFNAAFNQEPFQYGVFGIWEIGDGFTSENGPIEYDFVAPLKGLNGEDPLYAINLYPGYDTRWVITRDCEKPWIAARYADYYYDLDVSMTTIEGAIDGPNPRLVPCTVCNNGRALMVSTDVPEGMTILMFRDQSSAGLLPCGATREHYDERLHLHFTDRKVQFIDNQMKPFADKSYVPGALHYTVDEAERVNQILADLRDYTNRRGVEWVMGTGDIDADWDAYLSELKSMGVEDYVNYSQNAYTRFLDVMSK